MSNTAKSRSAQETLTTLSWVGIGLSILLGIAYLHEGVEEFTETLGIAFLLAGLAYFGATALVLTDYRRRLVYIMGIGYNALLVVLFFLIKGVEVSELIGFAGVVKLVQIVLIVLLGVILARDQ